MTRFSSNHGRDGEMREFREKQLFEHGWAGKVETRVSCGFSTSTEELLSLQTRGVTTNTTTDYAYELSIGLSAQKHGDGLVPLVLRELSGFWGQRSKPAAFPFLVKNRIIKR